MMLPEQWEIKSLGSVFPKIVVGYVGNVNDYYCSETEGVPFYRTLNIRDGYFRHDEVKFVTEEFNDRNKKSQIVNNDILIARVGANLGMVCKVSGILGKANIANAIIIKSNSVKNVDVDFFTYFLLSSMGKNQIYSGAAGGAQGVFNTKLTQEIKVPVPPLPEQIKIADILSTWDNAINTVQKLLANSQQQKKALMQQLLTGKKQLFGFDEEWQCIKLDDLFTFKRGKGLSKDNLVSTGKYKCVLYGELYTKYDEVIKSVISRTNATESVKSIWGDILIPSSTTTTGIDLAKAVAILEDDVFLGGDINILRPKSSSLCSVFMAYLLTHTKKYEIAAYAQGITIIHLYGSDIKKIRVSIPSLLEQQKIAAILTTADQEIDKLRTQLNHLKQQKKALMQQLLTGKRRVKIEEAA